MKTLLLILLASLAIKSVQAQTTNTARPTRDRLQNVIRKSSVSSTNTPAHNGTNVAKPFTQRLASEFIGTLVAVDKTNQTVSIAPGPPNKANRDKAVVISVMLETKVFKDKNPATLEDAIIGQEVRYGYRINRENKTHLLTLLRFTTNSTEKVNK